MSSDSSVYTIDTGKTKGTMFKIDTGGYVFSCLFDSGAEISCMNMETVAALGLTSQIMPSSISVNTANRDHMGVAGDVRINFKIGRKFSFTHNFVLCERLSHPFIIGKDFMRKHYMSLQWVPEKNILVHCKNCPTCAKQKVQKTQFKKQIFEPGVQPMEFICIDIIGEFYPPSSKGIYLLILNISLVLNLGTWGWRN